MTARHYRTTKRALIDAARDFENLVREVAGNPDHPSNETFMDWRRVLVEHADQFRTAVNKAASSTRHVARGNVVPLRRAA